MASLDERSRLLKEAFIENRGYWSPLWQQVLELSPDFFEAYTAFSSVPWKTGPLEPKVKEFVYIAVNIATTHLYVTGARTHVANALKFGAPPHGGSAPGLDRIVMLLAEEPNIREVIAFPMNQRAEDLMMQAPAEVPEGRLRELHLKLDLPPE